MSIVLTHQPTLSPCNYPPYHCPITTHPLNTLTYPYSPTHYPHTTPPHPPTHHHPPTYPLITTLRSFMLVTNVSLQGVAQAFPPLK